MALPPTIPTSFVPYATSGGTPRKFRTNLTGTFGFFAYAILLISVVLAIGVFAYGRLLAAEQAAKEAKLAEAEKNIDAATVESFVRLRNRLVSSKTLLGNHLAFSGFFDTFEQLLPATARLSTLHLRADTTGGVKLEGTGVAKTFNVLAAVSTALSKDGRFKDAIFSAIVVNPRDNSVSFAITATLDPKLVTFSPTASVPASAAPATEARATSATTTP